MKQQVLKALANPAHIFYVPYSLAVLNFIIQFLIWIVLFVASLIITKGENPVNPMFFLLSVIIVHSIMAIYSKRDPQIGQIIMAKIQLFKRKIPGKLAA
ncbi:MAG: VirB3 family type IV secretion system protein [Alphaproteobacteria bacterium]|nr:VirB3 family type IV secretion system protein [Alphaproteobacteria bacterium]